VRDRRAAARASIALGTVCIDVEIAGLTSGLLIYRQAVAVVAWMAGRKV
jgi:hypothetical protein